jgi:hypothetical protein
MVLLYPEPTLFTKHIFIPFTADAEKLAEALVNDETLQQIARQHGLRNANMASASNFAAPPALVNVIDAPSYEMLEAMINQISVR